MAILNEVVVFVFWNVSVVVLNIAYVVPTIDIVVFVKGWSSKTVLVDVASYYSQR